MQYKLLWLPLRMLELSSLQSNNVILVFPANRMQLNKPCNLCIL